MKKCGICKLELENIKFSKKGDGFQANCKECHKEYRKIHYKNSDDKYKEKVNNYRAVFSKYFQQFKNSLGGCQICSETSACCLDFHHIKDKEELVSRLVNRVSLDKLVKEINKCVIICSNCHRKIHNKELALDETKTISEDKCMELIQLIKSGMELANITMRKNGLL